MRKVCAIALAAISLYAVPVFAAQSTGLYLGPEIGSTRLEFDDADYSKSHMTWGGLVGWQFNPVFGAELGYYRASRISESDTVDGEEVSIDLKYSAITATFVGQYQFNDRYSAFARFGASFTRHDSVGDIGSHAWIHSGYRDVQAIYGLGLGASFDRTRVRLEYRRTKLAFAGSGAIALSLAWHVSKGR